MNLTEDTKQYRLSFFAREFIDVYRRLENDRKEVVESFIYEVLNVALDDNVLATNTKVLKSFNNNTIMTKAEGLACLIARLPEQEQAKIYYMLKGFEIFGKNPEKSTV